MKRKFISFMLVLTLVITALSLTGINLSSQALTYNDMLSVEGETEEWYYQTDYSNYNEVGGLEIYWYKGNQKNVVIPSEINGIPVTSVSNLWTDKERHEARPPHIYPWYDTSNVESIVVPETVKSLYGSFENLTNLKSVTLHEGLEVIGRNTFKNCTQLTEIDIPDSVVNIDVRAFENSGIKNKPEIIYIGGYYDLKGIKGSSEIIFNSPEVEFQNLRHAQVDKIICNGFIKFFEYYNDNLGVMDNKNLEIVCNGGIYSGLHEEYIYERGLYAHLDEETGVITYSSVPVEKGTEYVSGDYRYYLNIDNEAVISRYLGKDSEVTVPETIDGYTVGEIGTMAFAGGGDERYDSVILDSKQITSVVLPETVKKIGAFAFDWNVSLISVEMPDAVKVISSNAFERCVSLQNIDWPASLEAIGPMAFYKCDALTSIQIPEGVTRIGSNAFGNCKNLESVTFPESLTSIGYYAFISDKKLKSVSIPDSVTDLGIGAFRYCSTLTEANLPANIEAVPDLLFQSTDLKSIDIPETVTKIGIDAFCYTELSEVELPSNLKHIAEAAFYGAKLTKLNLPSSVEYVGPYAFGDNDFESLVIDWQNISTIQNATFESCKKLKSVEIKGRIREIRPYAFYDCIALEEIVLSDNVKKIYCSAFEYNTALETVTIPEGIDYLGASAFAFCTNLKTLYFNAAECKIDFSDDSYYTLDRQLPFSGCGITELHIGDNVEFLDRLMFAKLSSLVNVEIPASVKSIGDYTFAECTALQNVKFSGSVDSIGEYAFSKCAALQSIALPEGITKIDQRMFYSCSSLKSIVLPDTLKIISSFAFDGCESLESIDMPDNLETIGVYAFRDCTSLTEITIPEKVQGLNVNTFNNCTALKTIYYNAKNCSFTGVTESETEGINYSPFINCTALETVILNEDMTAIPDSFFCGLKSLKVVDIPAKVTTIGKGAFAYSSLTGLTGCEGVKNIRDYSFYKCESFDEFVLPEKVTDINPNTFAYSGLRSFVASDNLESILENAFLGCYNLQNVDLKNYIMIIEKNAFEGCSSLKNLVVPDSVISIGSRAFAECPALETVYMSVNVDFIPTECFYNDTALSSFTWEATSKLIGRLAFGNCTGLNNFNFIGIEKLYESSFYNSGVKVVTLGEALDEANALLEEIQTSTFQNCLELQTISIGGNVDTVSNLAFAGCANLEVAIISDNVTDIADDAFEDCPNLTFVCSETSYAYAYASENGIPVSTLVIAPIPNQTYTGSYIRPEVTVTLSNSSLTKDIDYTVSYSNNKNVGHATVTVSGRGSYDMLVSKAKFTIVTRSISKASIAEIKPQRYTGNPIEPSLTITDNGRYLREGTDYKVGYYDNVNHGKAYVSVVGKGNYSGSVQTTFMIEELGGSTEAVNWFESFLRNFFAKFISILLTMGFEII